MNYQVLVVDVDGTILEYGKKEVAKEVKDALYALQKAGVLVVISTGRMLEGVLALRQQLQMDEFAGYLICNNGGTIVKSDTLEILYEATLSQALVDEVSAFAMKKEIAMCMMQEQKVYVYGHSFGVEIEKKSIDATFMEIDQVKGYDQEKTFRINLSSDDQNLSELELELRATLKVPASIVQSMGLFIDVMAFGIDKGHGLEKLSALTGISTSQMVAVGDGHNDIEMLKVAAMGIAMGNASEEVKQIANHVAPTVDEHGVAWVANQYFLNEK